MTSRARITAALLVAVVGLVAARAAEGAPAYRMSLEVDGALGAFQGEVTVLWANSTGDELAEVCFRLYGNADSLYGSATIEIISASVGGDPAAPTLFAEDTVVLIALVHPLAPGETVDVRLEFRGRVADASAGFATETEYGLLTRSRDVVTLTGFYPILAPYTEEGWALDPVSSIGDPLFADAASYEVSVIVEPDVIVIPTADGSSLDADGRRRLEYSLTNLRDFSLAFVAGERSPLEASTNGVLLRSWFPARHAEAAAIALDRAQAAVEVYSALFGLLPYASIDIIEAPLQRAAGVECSGLFFVAAANASNPHDSFFDVIVSHEMAHQWFYAAVGNDPAEEPWLDEALATYASNIFLSTVVSAAAARAERASWDAAYGRARQAYPDLRASSPVYEFPNSDTYAAFVYSGGALELDALRLDVGDDAFFAAVAAYYASRRGAIATGTDLDDAFQRACGCRPASVLWDEESAPVP
jgi:hypothetical protein